MKVSTMKIKNLDIRMKKLKTNGVTLSQIYDAYPKINDNSNFKSLSNSRYSLC